MISRLNKKYILEGNNIEFFTLYDKYFKYNLANILKPEQKNSTRRLLNPYLNIYMELLVVSTGSGEFPKHS